MRAPSIVLVIGLTLAGCGGCSGPTEDTSPTSSATQRTEASGSESSSPDPEAAGAPVDPGPAPVLRITGTPERDGPVAIRVENHGTDAAELSGRLIVEHREGEAWEPARASLDLRYSCEDRAPECLTLAPGAVLIPPAWLGTWGDAQCVCTRCGPADPGSYRLVATSCSGAHRIESDPFDLPAR